MYSPSPWKRASGGGGGIISVGAINSANTAGQYSTLPDNLYAGEKVHQS